MRAIMPWRSDIDCAPMAAQTPDRVLRRELARLRGEGFPSFVVAWRMAVIAATASCNGSTDKWRAKLERVRPIHEREWHRPPPEFERASSHATSGYMPDEVERRIAEVAAASLRDNTVTVRRIEPWSLKAKPTGPNGDKPKPGVGSSFGKVRPRECGYCGDTFKSKARTPVVYCSPRCKTAGRLADKAAAQLADFDLADA